MHFEKLIYSKCPRCKKYGIEAMKGIGYRTNYDIQCRFCKRIYRVNMASSFLYIIVNLLALLVFLGVIHIFDLSIPTNVIVVLCLIVYCFFLRFLPLEEKK